MFTGSHKKAYEHKGGLAITSDQPNASKKDNKVPS